MLHCTWPCASSFTLRSLAHTAQEKIYIERDVLSRAPDCQTLSIAAGSQVRRCEAVRSSALSWHVRSATLISIVDTACIISDRCVVHSKQMPPTTLQLPRFCSRPPTSRSHYYCCKVCLTHTHLLHTCRTCALDSLLTITQGPTPAVMSISELVTMRLNGEPPPATDDIVLLAPQDNGELSASSIA